MDQNDALFGQEVEPEGTEEDEQQDSVIDGQDGSSMESLLEEQGINLDLPSQGEIRKGNIATISENEILVSVGTKSEGIISGRELEQIPDEERDAFEVGQEIPVYVLLPEDSNGNVVLSYTRAREEKDWDEVEILLESGDTYDSEVIGYNKGGLIVPIGKLRGFVPASQISLLRRSTSRGDTPDQRFSDLVGELMTVSIIEVDRARRRLILSERQALNETRESLKDRLLEELQEGDVRAGRVTSLADFGAFVNIEGADGLVHLSEISWDRIQHPNEVLAVGQEVDVKVISLDHDRKRIGLSIRQLQRDPWLDNIGDLQEGSLIEGKITHLTKFGAFARIGEDLEGLIHISELSEQRIEHPKEVLKEGDTVTLRVIKIDPERRRIGLSLRKVDSPAYSDFDWKMALAEEISEDTAPEDASTAQALDESAMEDASPEAEAPAESVEEEISEEIIAGEEPSKDESPEEEPSDQDTAPEAVDTDELPDQMEVEGAASHDEPEEDIE
jgi:small subunit ribosomal protein S1